jgi:hypothetical protein
MERKDGNEMDFLAIAVITLGVVVGMLVLRRAEERARREDSAYVVMTRLNCYATRRPRAR